MKDLSISNAVNNVNNRMQSLETCFDKQSSDNTDINFLLKFNHTKQLVTYSYIKYEYKLCKFINLTDNDDNIIEQIISQILIQDLSIGSKNMLYTKIICKHSTDIIYIYIINFESSFKNNKCDELILNLEKNILNILNNNFFILFNNYLNLIKSNLHDKSYKNLQLLNKNISFYNYQIYKNIKANVNYNELNNVTDCEKLNFVDTCNSSCNNYHYNYNYNRNNNIEEYSINGAESLKSFESNKSLDTLKSYNNTDENIDTLRNNF